MWFYYKHFFEQLHELLCGRFLGGILAMNALGVLFTWVEIVMGVRGDAVDVCKLFIYVFLRFAVFCQFKEY